MIEARAAYSRGDYVLAQQLTTELVDDGGSDKHLYQLEKGVTDLAVGDIDDAIQTWEAATYKLDELDGGSWAGDTAAWLSDDNALDYDGAAYERVMVRVAKLIAESVAPNREMGDDIIAFGNQIIDEHERIYAKLTEERDDLGGNSVASPEAQFQFVGFGSYLVGTVLEQDPTAVDEARLQYQTAARVATDRAFVEQGLQRIESGRFTEHQGDGVLHVFGMVGRGPYKVESSITAAQSALNLASVIYAIIEDTPAAIGVTPVPIDVLQYHPDNPDALAVELNGQAVGSTAIVSDIERIAQLEYDATIDYRVARALIRRTLKQAATQAAATAVQASSDNGWAALLTIIFGAIWTGVEQADLRCWSLLPATCQAFRAELEPGEYDVVLRASVRGVPTGTPQTIRVRIRPGRNTYVVAMAPTQFGGPAPLSRDAIEVAPLPADPFDPDYEPNVEPTQ